MSRQTVSITATACACVVLGAAIALVSIGRSVSTPAGATSPPVVGMTSKTASQAEGNSGTAPITLGVALSHSTTNSVTVHYATANGSATTTDNDYVATSGTLTFAPGTTTSSIAVSIVGDTKLEDYETFSVKLSSPTNATIGSAATTVTILNDDTPQLAMANVPHVTAGAPAVFMPHLVQRYFQPLTLHASTVDGTAAAGTDYTAVSNDVTFPAGSKSAVPTSVPTDIETLPDGPEKFSLTVDGAGVVSGVTRTASIDGTCTGATPPSTYQHVVVVVMENKLYSNVIGSSTAPFQTALARACGSANHYATVSSPSRPNYIGMTSGDTYGCGGSDADPPGGCTPSSPSVFGQVIANGGTALTYEESMTTNCQQVSSGLYATKHNPWAYYQGESALCAQYDQPMPASLDATNLPTLLYLVPNICNDTHNCSVATGDQWLQSELTPILQSAGFASGSTAVIVTYDEYTNLPNMFAARSVRPGTLVTTATSHYGFLRTIEDMLGLAPLGQAASAATLRTPLHL